MLALCEQRAEVRWKRLAVGSWGGSQFDLAVGHRLEQRGGFTCMEAVLKLPIDLTSLPGFRQLRGVLGFSGAVAALVVLWQELAYRLQEGGVPGRLEAGEVASVREELGKVVGSVGERGSVGSVERAGEGKDAESPIANRQSPIEDRDVFEELVKARWLVADPLAAGGTMDFVCPRFALLHCGNGSRSQAQQGGDMKAFNAKQKRSGKELFKQGCLIASERFVDEEGKPLEAEAARRCMALIVGCDNALFKGERPQHLFTEGLVQEALRVARRYADEEIDVVLRSVVKNRNHALLGGMTAEKLLPRFGEVLGELEA